MRFTKKVFAAIGIILLISSCSLAQKSDREIMSEIYSDSLAFGFGLGGRGNVDYCKDGDLVVNSSTIADHPFTEDFSLQLVKNDLPQLEQETWESFLEVNSRQVSFPIDLNLGCKYTLLDEKQNPPDSSLENSIGVLYFSQIGFDPAKHQALVFIMSAGDRFSVANFYLAEIVDGHWRVIGTMQAMIT